MSERRLTRFLLLDSTCSRAKSQLRRESGLICVWGSEKFVVVD